MMKIGKEFWYFFLKKGIDKEIKEGALTKAGFHF
jgi:hypothetical protein